jgi:hypothetical protein
MEEVARGSVCTARSLLLADHGAKSGSGGRAERESTRACQQTGWASLPYSPQRSVAGLGLVLARERRDALLYLHRAPGFLRFFVLLSVFDAGMQFLVLAGSDGRTTERSSEEKLSSD